MTYILPQRRNLWNDDNLACPYAPVRIYPCAVSLADTFPSGGIAIIFFSHAEQGVSRLHDISARLALFRQGLVPFRLFVKNRKSRKVGLLGSARHSHAG